MLAALRGSYGGILMFGMMGQLAGLTLVNPLTAVIGIGLGRRALKDERKRQLTYAPSAGQASDPALPRRRVVRRQQGLARRDPARPARLRDEFTARAEQLQRSTREALAAAETRRPAETAQDATTASRTSTPSCARIAAVRKAADDPALHARRTGATA